MNNQLPVHGRYFIEHRDGVGKLIGIYRVPNGITDQGMNDLLDVAFGNDTQHALWYFGLINSSGYTGDDPGDTLASHAGWTAWTTYSGDRKNWVVGAAAGRAISNGVTADFNITGSGTLKGIFATDQETSDVGILWSTALFSSPVSVQSGDTLKITYTVSG